MLEAVILCSRGEFIGIIWDIILLSNNVYISDSLPPKNIIRLNHSLVLSINGT
jgi:hypothetical protein